MAGRDGCILTSAEQASPGSIQIYGMPYVIVDSTVPKKAVQFLYYRESDGVNHTTNVSFPFYPIPDAAITQPHLIEGGYPGNVDRRGIQDRHLILVDRDTRHLYELYNVFYDGTKWLANSGAFFDMKTNNRRPDGWTSADAAGLAILPGLVRYEEAFGANEITPRVSRHRACDQWLRISGLASSRLKPCCAADGRTTPPEGEQGPVEFPARIAANF